MTGIQLKETKAPASLHLGRHGRRPKPSAAAPPLPVPPSSSPETAGGQARVPVEDGGGEASSTCCRRFRWGTTVPVFLAFVERLPVLGLSDAVLLPSVDLRHGRRPLELLDADLWAARRDLVWWIWSGRPWIHRGQGAERRTLGWAQPPVAGARVAPVCWFPMLLPLFFPPVAQICDALDLWRLDQGISPAKSISFEGLCALGVLHGVC